MVEIPSFSFTGNESLFPKQNRKKKKNTCRCLSHLNVCSLSLILCALCFQSPVGKISGAQKSQFFQSTRLPYDGFVDSFLDSLKIEKSKCPVTAKYCSRVLYLGWWCYTGGGRGESSTPKQCKAIWVLTKALKQIKSIFDQVFWLEQWLKLLLQTDQWVCLGWGWKETPLSSRLLWLS